MYASLPPRPEALVAEIDGACSASDDPDFVAVCARAALVAGDVDRASRWSRHSLMVAPDHALTLLSAADVAERKNDLATRRRLLDDCIAKHSDVALCVENSLQYCGLSCSEVEQRARAVAGSHDEQPLGYLALLWSVSYQGRGEEEATAAGEQFVLGYDDEDRKRMRFRVRATTALDFGHLDDADALASAAIDELATDNDSVSLAYWIRLIVADERGDAAAVSRLVEAMLAREPLWGAPWDLRGELLVRARRAGALTDLEFRKRRDAARAEFERSAANQGPTLAPFRRWVDGWARMAATPEDVEEAVAKFESEHLEQMPRREADVVGAAALWLAAGKPERASAALDVPLCSLRLTAFPFYVRVTALRARVLEANGDKAGACSAWSSVLARWERLPRSRTVDEARAGRARLGCGELH
jgi:hypothetical protein